MTEVVAKKKLNICIFCDDETMRKFLAKVLAVRGYNVYFYDYPKDCLVVFGEKGCICTRKERCSDMVILWSHMHGLKATNVLKSQSKGGCKLTIKNKIVLCGVYDMKAAEEAEILGVTILYLPFPLEKLYQWLDGCEERLRKM